MPKTIVEDKALSKESQWKPPPRRLFAASIAWGARTTPYTSKARQEFKARMKFEDGLKETIRWYLDSRKDQPHRCMSS